MADIFLFDIDRTLIWSRGVGSAAMNAVMLEMFGVSDALAGVDFGGRTDRSILREALTNHGRTPDDFEAFIGAFESAYVPVLEAELRARGGEVLPGVHDTLAAVHALAGVRVGLVTGNFRRAAQVKLRHFDLDGFFADGGFADDAEERAELVRIAIERLGGRRDGGRVVVIGDTGHDIAAALANGAVAVGVATGGVSAAALAGAGAAHVVSDLTTPTELLRAIFAAQREAHEGSDLHSERQFSAWR